MDMARISIVLSYTFFLDIKIIFLTIYKVFSNADNSNEKNTVSGNDLDDK